MKPKITLRELWLLTTYVGNIQIENDDNFVSEPLLKTTNLEMVALILDNNHEYHHLADREVEYFDFVFNTMRIKLKKEE